MNTRFAKCLRELQPKSKKLEGMMPFKMDALPKNIPKAGVYLFSERGRHLYVGRSSNIRGRLRNHCRRHHNAASFAFLLARKKTGNLKPTYKREGSRAHLMSQATFRTAFFSQIERVKRMDIRFVKERNPWRRMLLEAYVAIELKTPYNKFKET